MKLSKVLSVCLVAVLGSAAFADGLGDPGIPVATGSGIVSAGVGIEFSQPGTITLDVPGNVQQALLYWSGDALVNVYDDEADVDFNSSSATVAGYMIGAPQYFFNDENNYQVFVSTFRADVTDFIEPGLNTVTVSGLDFGVDPRGPYGAGLLVIYDDGTTSNISLLDGQDLAFSYFPAPRDATVPQTFTFDAAAEARDAALTLIVASVEPGRRSRINVSVDGGTPTAYDDLLNSTDGYTWDTLVLPVSLPAGSTSVTVEVISVNDGVGTPAAMNWIAAGLSVPQTSTGGGDECDSAPVIDDHSRSLRNRNRCWGRQDSGLLWIDFDATAGGEFCDLESVEAEIETDCGTVRVRPGTIVHLTCTAGRRHSWCDRCSYGFCFGVLFIKSDEAVLHITATNSGGHTTTTDVDLCELLND